VSLESGLLGLGDEQVAHDNRVVGLRSWRGGQPVQFGHDYCGLLPDPDELLGCPAGDCSFGPVGFQPQN
jgi:hypothetical protein